MRLTMITKFALVTTTLSGGVSAFSVPSSSLGAPSQSCSNCAATTSTSSSPLATMSTLRSSGPGQGEGMLVSRRDALGAFGVAMSSFVFAAAAAEAKVGETTEGCEDCYLGRRKQQDDPNLKGTKADPDFVNCVSQCIYFCTKSKEEARTRQDCLPECRKSCAKTKAQGLVGMPRT